MSNELRGALTGLALVTVLGLGLVSINLDIPGQALLQTLRFHIAALLALLVLGLILGRAYWRAALFALCCAASVGEGVWLLKQMYDSRDAAAATPHQPLMTLMSFNLLSSNENGPQLARMIAASGADVVFVMESEPLFAELGRLSGTYLYRAGCDREESCDLMILSKTPLSGVRFADLGTTWRNRLITARTEIGGAAVNLVAAHMVKPYFDQASEGEAYVLRQHLDGIEGPLVLAGDFNAAAWSDNIARLIRRSGLIVAPFMPATWPVDLGPLGVPIDNVFTRSGLLIDRLEAMPDAMGSNHRGLIAELSLAR